MLSNQYLDAKPWMDYLGQRRSAHTDLDRFVNNVWEK